MCPSTVFFSFYLAKLSSHILVLVLVAHVSLKAGGTVSQTVDLGYVVGPTDPAGPTGPAGPSNLVTVEIDYAQNAQQIGGSVIFELPDDPEARYQNIIKVVRMEFVSLVPEGYKILYMTTSSDIRWSFQEGLFCYPVSVAQGWYGYNPCTFATFVDSSVNKDDPNTYEPRGTIYLTCSTS